MEVKFEGPNKNMVIIVGFIITGIIILVLLVKPKNIDVNVGGSSINLETHDSTKKDMSKNDESIRKYEDLNSSKKTNQKHDTEIKVQTHDQSKAIISTGENANIKVE